MGLSIRRAKMVKSWLVNHGIDSSRLLVQGFGERRPKWPNDREGTRRLNRRVEIKTIGFVTVATRGVSTAITKEASFLLAKGQEMVAMDKCRESIPIIKQALKLFENANDYLNAQVARQSLVLGYSCIGELKKAIEADK